MNSTNFLEMHHAMGLGVGSHSSQIYDSKFCKANMCARLVNEIYHHVGKIVQIWTQSGAGENLEMGGSIRDIALIQLSDHPI